MKNKIFLLFSIFLLLPFHLEASQYNKTKQFEVIYTGACVVPECVSMYLHNTELMQYNIKHCLISFSNSVRADVTQGGWGYLFGKNCRDLKVGHKYKVHQVEGMAPEQCCNHAKQKPIMIFLPEAENLFSSADYEIIKKFENVPAYADLSVYGKTYQGKVYGTVTANNQPVSNMVVELIEGHCFTPSYKVTHTDEMGNYHFDGVPLNTNLYLAINGFLSGQYNKKYSRSSCGGFAADVRLSETKKIIQHNMTTKLK